MQNYYFNTSHPKCIILNLCDGEEDLSFHFTQPHPQTSGRQCLSRNREEFGRLGSVFLQRPSHYGGQREAEQTPGKYRAGHRCYFRVGCGSGIMFYTNNDLIGGI